MTVPGFHQPTSVEEAVGLLAQLEGARCIAGGATLVAMINANLIEPKALVSLRRIPELVGISPAAGGGFRIGAMTRHRETAAETRLAGTLAVLRAAARQIANPVVRNMGTIGGSIAFADAAADYPPALVAVNAEIEIAGKAGRRRVKAEEFFVDWYTTVLAPDEVVAAVIVPCGQAGVGHYEKLARVAGDFAIASIALAVARRDPGFSVRVAVGGCGPRPVHLPEVDALLARGFANEAVVREAGAKLAAAADPVDDVRASADYRRTVVPRLLAVAIAEARTALSIR